MCSSSGYFRKTNPPHPYQFFAFLFPFFSTPILKSRFRTSLSPGSLSTLFLHSLTEPACSKMQLALPLSAISVPLSLESLSPYLRQINIHFRYFFFNFFAQKRVLKPPAQNGFTSTCHLLQFMLLLYETRFRHILFFILLMVGILPSRPSFHFELPALQLPVSVSAVLCFFSWPVSYPCLVSSSLAIIFLVAISSFRLLFNFSYLALGSFLCLRFKFFSSSTFQVKFLCFSTSQVFKIIFLTTAQSNRLSPRETRL